MWKRMVLDEVTDQVSTLKKDYSQLHLPRTDDDLGLENATFKWNEVAEHVDKDSDKGKSKVVLLLLQIQLRRTKLVWLSGTVFLRGAPKTLRESEGS
jgi:hypothetical protein